MDKVLGNFPANDKPLSSREKLTIIGKLIIDTCSCEEIEILCVSLLDTNLKCGDLLGI